MRERHYPEEWYAAEPELLDIQMDPMCVEIAVEHSDELIEHARSWFRVYYHGRNLARRPPYDREACKLKAIKIVPYSLPGDRQPAMSIIGVYEVELPHSDPQMRQAGITESVTREDHEPLHVYIDTHGGNFDHLSLLVEQNDSMRVLDLSPEFSEHVAELMKDYYDLFCSP